MFERFVKKINEKLKKILLNLASGSLVTVVDVEDDPKSGFILSHTWQEHPAGSSSWFTDDPIFSTCFYHSHWLWVLKLMSFQNTKTKEKSKFPDEEIEIYRIDNDDFGDFWTIILEWNFQKPGWEAAQVDEITQEEIYTQVCEKVRHKMKNIRNCVRREEGKLFIDYDSKFTFNNVNGFKVSVGETDLDSKIVVFIYDPINGELIHENSVRLDI